MEIKITLSFLLAFFFLKSFSQNDIETNRINKSISNWTQTNTPPGGSVWDIAVIDDYIVAGTGAGGVYFSEDQGDTWEQRNGAFPNMEVLSLAVNGTDIFAGAMDFYGGKIYKSSDYGMNWMDITPTGFYFSAGISDLVVNSTHIFATGFAGVIVKSPLNNISSSSWELFSTGLNIDVDVISLKINELNIYAGTYGDGVWVSSMNNADWNLTSTTMSTDSSYIQTIDIVDGTYYAGNISGDHPVLYRSIDNGKNWIQSSTSVFENTPVYALIHNGNEIYAGTEGVGALISTDDGVTWSALNEGFKDDDGNWYCNQINIRSFAFSGDYIYAGTDCGVWKREVTVLGTNDINMMEETLVFYPNPTKNFITVSINSNLIGSKYLIADSLGKVVLNGKIAQETFNINLQGLDVGIYNVSFENLNIQNFKFIKD